MTLSGLRGMPDLFPEDLEKHQALIKIFQAVSALYGCRPIATPIVEPLDVFSRAVGETSDIVSKEMYTLMDRNEKKLCLRPENTAGIMRAILNANLAKTPHQKYMYVGPMFRYERPQKGRLRQFHQLGIEYIATDSPFSDAEIIGLAHHFIEDLQIKNFTLEINSLGDQETRIAHKKSLVDYFETYKADLSDESQKRLATNPLRILDSKDQKDKELSQGAPKLSTYLTKDSRLFFDTVCKTLDAMKIPFVLNPFLVRGLDYYSHTIFEFKSKDLGAQETFLAGGRYDHLAQQLGHPDLLPSIGWAAGIERLALTSPLCPIQHKNVLIIPGFEEALPACLTLAKDLRRLGISAQYHETPSIKGGLKRANKEAFSLCILIGEEELSSETVTLKDMVSSQQNRLTYKELFNTLKTS